MLICSMFWLLLLVVLQQPVLLQQLLCSSLPRVWRYLYRRIRGLERNMLCRLEVCTCAATSAQNDSTVDC
jgi:hypothetical protein